MYRINGHLFQKKYIAFLTLVPILLLTAVIQMDCPVCDGTGYVLGAPGMEDVSLVDIDYDQRYVNRDMNMCGMFVMYLYDVTLSVVNKGLEDTWGYVKLTLVDLVEGQVVGSEYVILAVPGNTSLDVSFVVWFRSLEDFYLLRDKVTAEIVLDEVSDMTCSGKGRLALNTWLVVIVLEDSLVELGREQAQYYPPPDFDIEDEQWN